MASNSLKGAFSSLNKSPNFSEESNNLLVQKGNQLHAMILAVVSVITIGYVSFDLLNSNFTQALISSTLLPSLAFSYWLFKYNRTEFSKIWNLFHVSIIIGIQFFFQPPNSLCLTLYLPVLLSTLIVFQGKDRKLGYVLASLVFILAIILYNCKPLFDYYSRFPHESIDTLRTINISGAISVTILEVIFLLQLNNSIQHILIEKSSDLNKNNDFLAANIQTREKMLSILSHDLRSPLIIIDSGIEAILSDDFPPEGKKRLGEELRKRSKSTLNLIDNLLLWSRSQTDQINFNPKPIEISEIEKIIKENTLTHGGEKDIQINYSIPEKGGINADKDMLEGMFRNLISNSIKFTPNGGNINVLVEPSGKKWRITISDSGIGMTPELIEKLRNGDIHSSYGTNKEKGHGLGLQLVRDFLQKHGSELKIQSELGKGTSFSFELESA